ncbi:MAG: SIS domain-containing protein [bacterium]
MSKSTLVLDSIAMLPNQLLDGLKTKLDMPKNYKNIDRVVISGMGGSNLAARIINSTLANDLKVPILINNSYEVPAYVDRNTLFIASSYSGNTEETISAYCEAKKNKAKIIVLTADNKSKLAKLALKDKYPIIVFSTEFNPSQQPRFGLGYSLITMLMILQKAGVIKSKDREIRNAVKRMEIWNSKLTPNKSNNQASKIASRIFSHNIMLITGEFLEGSAHTFRNQLNENSKNFACYLTLPELNHYAMEGLAKPKDTNLICLCFESSLYSPNVQKRMKLTNKVINKNKIKVVKETLRGKNKLEQALEMLQLGAWVTYYLAELNKVDPIKIPWVDWFKKELK